jgi:hypothetical protein
MRHRWYRAFEMRPEGYAAFPVLHQNESMLVGSVNSSRLPHGSRA